MVKIAACHSIRLAMESGSILIRPSRESGNLSALRLLQGIRSGGQAPALRGMFSDAPALLPERNR